MGEEQPEDHRPIGRRFDAGAGDDAGPSAGGKLTKRPFRPRASPYSRPPREERKKADGWLSKLFVQPAARVLPLLFSSSRHRGPSPSEPNLENEQAELDGASILNCENQFPEAKEQSASAETGQTKVGSEGDEIIEHKGDVNDSSDLATIEQQFKHKTFTRDESNRLIELLRSRTVDHLDNNRHAAGLIVEATDVPLGQKDSRTLAKEDAAFSLISEPLQLTGRSSNAQAISSSPVDIAKAYMGSRRSESEYECQTEKSKKEKQPSNDDSSALFFSPALKSPICWPGAVVHGDHGYLTPQPQGGRTGLHNFPRTPYSGALFSRSTSKVQGGAPSPNLSSSGWKQSYTPAFSANSAKRRRSSVLDDGWFVNPICPARKKGTVTASEEVGPSNRATSFSLLPNSSDGSKGISSTFQGDLVQDSSTATYRNFHSIGEADEAPRFAIGSSTVHPQSTKMARRILDHLDRPVLTKEKSFELELAAARTKAPPKSDDRDKQSVTFPDDPKSGYIFGRGTSDLEKADARKVTFGASTSKSQDKEKPLFLRTQTDKLVSFEPARNSIDLKPLSPSERSISVTPFPNRKAKSSNSVFSFTFPVSPASNIFTEPPPTPTMNSSIAAGKMVHTTEDTVPTFGFGSSRTDGRLVFSFGSIASSAATDNDIAAPKFKFGSEEKRNMSFKPVDKDAVCY